MKTSDDVDQVGDETAERPGQRIPKTIRSGVTSRTVVSRGSSVCGKDAVAMIPVPPGPHRV